MMVKRAEKSDGVYTGKGQLRFIEVASHLLIIMVSVSTRIFQVELSPTSLVFALILW